MESELPWLRPSSTGDSNAWTGSRGAWTLRYGGWPTKHDQLCSPKPLSQSLQCWWLQRAWWWLVPFHFFGLYCGFSLVHTCHFMKCCQVSSQSFVVLESKILVGVVESFKEENVDILSGFVRIRDGCTRCWGENILLLKVLDGLHPLWLL